MSVFFGLFLSLSGFSTRFYVAGAGLGSDTPGNGGQFNPLETVSFAISQAANGDTIGFTKCSQLSGNEYCG